MERVELAAGGPVFSRLVYGVWRLRDDPMGSTVERVTEKIERCLEVGITTFDQADIYGDYRCEELFGAALRSDKGLRERIEIVTKCDICLVSQSWPDHRIKHYDTGAAHLEASVERSLGHLSTDHVELLLLHRPDPLMNADETAAALRSLVSSGKVLHVGVSNFTPSQFDLLQSRLDLPLVTNQIELSIFRTESLVDGTLDHCQLHRYKPMAWSPMAGGRLFEGADRRATAVRAAVERVAKRLDQSVDQVALGWILALPSQPLPILGTNRKDRIQSAAEAESVELDRQSWFEIYEASLGQPVP